MWLQDDEQRALLESTGRITERVSRAVQAAMQALRFGALHEDIEKVYRLAQRLDEMQRKQIKAELRSLSAKAATFKSNVEE